MPDEDFNLQGYRELSVKLSKLGQKIGGKILRSSMMRATTPTVRKMKSRVPVGTKAHRTYKRKLVAPGFASRSIKRVTRIKDGYASVRIGVRREAFYAIQFLDTRPGRTPYRVTKRRVGRRSRFTGKSYSTEVSVRPYTIGSKPWFFSVFEADSKSMVKSVGTIMGKLIEKAAVTK